MIGEWLILLLVASGSTAGERCSVDALISVRRPHITYVLSRAMPDTVPVPTSVMDFSDRAFMPPAEELAAGPPVGQRFEVLAKHGTSVQLELGSEFVAVPWEYDAACDTHRWRGSARWVEPGGEVLFSLWPTRSDHDRAVFDVVGWHQPYPWGEFWKHEGRRDPPPDRNDWLSAREYYNLIAELPEVPEGSAPPDSIVAQVRQTLTSSGRWSRTFPGNEILMRYSR